MDSCDGVLCQAPAGQIQGLRENTFLTGTGTSGDSGQGTASQQGALEHARTALLTIMATGSFAFVNSASPTATRGLAVVGAAQRTESRARAWTEQVLQPIPEDCLLTGQGHRHHLACRSAVPRPCLPKSFCSVNVRRQWMAIFSRKILGEQESAQR